VEARVAQAHLPEAVEVCRPPFTRILGFCCCAFASRTSCWNEDYWQVYFDTNRAIRETFAGAGYPAPEQLVVVRSGT